MRLKVIEGTAIPFIGAPTLSIGIAIPNFPEGAMIYVVAKELISEMSACENSNIGVVMFAPGFTLMMTFG